MTNRRQKARRARRGRPKLAAARRRATTVAGRAPPIDPGSPELLRHRALVTGSILLPGDLLGALYGRAILDLDAYTAGREFAALIRLVRLGLGLTEASPSGTWRTILAATSRGRPAFDFGYPGSDSARRVLTRFRREMAQQSWRAVGDAVDNLWPTASNFNEFILDLRSGLYYLAPRLPISPRSTL